MVVACVAVEAAKGTPIKNKLTPKVDLPTSGQDAAEKAISSKQFAFSHFLGGCKLMLKCLVPLRYKSTFSSCLSFCSVGFVKLLAKV